MADDQRIRVAVVATGGVGTYALRSVVRRANLELVGVWVHSHEKAGVDAGELVGLGPLGIRTTNDLDEIIALAPDCAIYSAAGPEQDPAAVRDYARLLTAGINVVCTSTPGLLNPKAWVPTFVEQIQAAAFAGGSTAYSSGIEPGFSGDHLPILLTTLSDTIRSIRAQEIFDYSSYPNTFLMFDAMGFSKPMEYTSLAMLPGALRYVWGPSVSLVAEALHIVLDEITDVYERELTPRELTVAAGVIPAGTVGAVRIQTIGWVRGQPAIVIEHVNRMAPDLAPHWASAPNGTYRVMIEGDPDITCELRLGHLDTSAAANDAGMKATAMRVVNAVPYVVAAPAGIASALDLPITAPHDPFAQ